MNKIEIKKSNYLIDYESAFDFMKKKLKEIQLNRTNELMWFLEHDHIYTQGTSSNQNEIIKKIKLKLLKQIEVEKLHIMGQSKITYLLINLNNRKKDIRKFIDIIENSVINFLSEYKIEARSFKNRVGIWVTNSNGITFDKEKKIGAIGLRVSKWVTYHGLSFNINPNLKNYDFIHPCGLEGYKNTSLKDLNINISKDEFDNKFEKYSKKIFLIFNYKIFFGSLILCFYK